MKNILLIIVLFCSLGVFAQTGIGTTTPNASAQLEVSSTTKGFLPPRMTAAQRGAIPVSITTAGLLVFQIDAPAGYYFYTGSDWELLGGNSTPDATTTTAGKIQLAGDLSGTAASPTVPSLASKVDKVAGSSLITDASITRLANTSGTNTGDQTNITGNAATATKLATARTIGGVGFDGSASINLPGVNTAGNQNTSGNAATATKLQTARTIAVSGAVTGNTTFDGSANATITTTAASSPTLTLNGDVSGSATFTNLGNATLTTTVANNSHSHSNYLSVNGGTVSGSLYVTGEDSYSISAYNWVSVSQNTIGYATTSPNNYSIYALNRIASPEFNAFSDKRIKTDINPIVNSLETIKKLKPSSYTKIDKVHYGNGLFYGFIAQELEQVIPEAVTIGIGEIPILQKFENASLEDGVTYVLEVSKDGKITQQDYNTTQARPQGDVFVINKKIDDFRTVDYNIVFTHAVAAIQEQQRLIEALQKENLALKVETASLKEAVQNQNTSLNEIKAMVEGLVKKELANK